MTPSEQSTKPEEEKPTRNYHSKGGRRPIGNTPKVTLPVSRVSTETATIVRVVGPSYPGGMPNFVEDAIYYFANTLKEPGQEGDCLAQETELQY